MRTGASGMDRSKAGKPDPRRGLEWVRRIHPVTEHYARRLQSQDLRGTTVCGWMHLTPNTILIIEPLIAAGARVWVGACNAHSTNPDVVAHLMDLGAEVYSGDETSGDYRAHLDAFADRAPDVVCDMGGELITACVRRGVRPRGALEATTTGIERIKGLALTFPVFDWNAVAIKDDLHNRHHVGDATWPAFTALTGITLFGRRVLVIGYGPVGAGVAERAKSLGAVVSVVERDPVRAMKALHAGCDVLAMNEGLAQADIVVTATGKSGILTSAEFAQLRPGAVVLNVGHSADEIDTTAAFALPHRALIDGVHEIETPHGGFYLLNRGSLLNLSGAGGFRTSDAFDPFSAIMLAGMAWILSDAYAAPPDGLHPLPQAIEADVAQAALAARSRPRTT